MIYIATQAGTCHTISEDAVLVGDRVIADTLETFEMPERGFVCVADGVGGNRGGAIASRYVLKMLAQAGTSTQDLRRLLFSIDEDLLQMARKTPDAPDMATTLTGVCIRDDAYRLIHVGNTRAYVRQGRYLKQITSDHTTYRWLISSGQNEAAQTCNKNEITNCFGGSDTALLSRLIVNDLAPFSLLLLTSDGVHEYVELDVLEDILNGTGSYTDKCEAILAEAIKNGSEDDMTVMVVIPAE